MTLNRISVDATAFQRQPDPGDARKRDVLTRDAKLTQGRNIVPVNQSVHLGGGDRR